MSEDNIIENEEIVENEENVENEQIDEIEQFEENEQIDEKEKSVENEQFGKNDQIDENEICEKNLQLEENDQIDENEQIDEIEKSAENEKFEENEQIEEKEKFDENEQIEEKEKFEENEQIDKEEKSLKRNKLNQCGTDIQMLPNKWSFYFFKNDRRKKWIDNMMKVVDFETVQDFWGLMCHVLPPSKLLNGCDYYMFKRDIKPMWEDDKNKNGGMWVITVEKNSVQLDPYWLEILMALVIEFFEDDSKEVTGAVINIRERSDRISVWTTDNSNTEALKRIGQKIKNDLNLTSIIEYTSHIITNPQTYLSM